MNLRFEWDENKNLKNIKKHKVSFKEASTIFADEHLVIFEDVKHSLDEERFIAIGRSLKDNILFVCYCERENDIIRIISARKELSKKEREVYYENNN